MIGDLHAIFERAKIYRHDDIIDNAPVDRRPNGIRTLSLTIEHHTWIGVGALVLVPVDVIGEGAVMASDAVVTSNVQLFAIIGAVPARVLRHRCTAGRVLASEDGGRFCGKA